jgi:hypothetical protein
MPRQFPPSTLSSLRDPLTRSDELALHSGESTCPRPRGRAWRRTRPPRLEATVRVLDSEPEHESKSRTTVSGRAPSCLRARF